MYIRSSHHSLPRDFSDAVCGTGKYWAFNEVDTLSELCSTVEEDQLHACSGIYAPFCTPSCVVNVALFPPAKCRCSGFDAACAVPALAPPQPTSTIGPAQPPPPATTQQAPPSATTQQAPPPATTQQSPSPPPVTTQQAGSPPPSSSNVDPSSLVPPAQNPSLTSQTLTEGQTMPGALPATSSISSNTGNRVSSVPGAAEDNASISLHVAASTSTSHLGSEYLTTRMVGGSVFISTVLTTSTGVEILPSGSYTTYSDGVVVTTAPTGSSGPAQSAADHRKSHVGAIVGELFGALFILALILGLILCRRRLKRKAAAAASSEFVDVHGEGPAILVTSPNGRSHFNADMRPSYSKFDPSTRNRPASELLPAYTADDDAYTGLAEKEKEGLPSEEHNGYGVGFGGQ